MTRCSNPRCSRQAKLRASDAAEIWGKDEAPTCVPCYIALAHGTKRHPAEVSFERIEGTDLKESDVEEIVGAY